MRWKFMKNPKKVLKICLIICLAIVWGILMRLYAESRNPENFSPREGLWYCAELDSRLCYDPGGSFEPFTYLGQPVDGALIGYVGEFLLERDRKPVFRSQIKSFHKENGVFVVIESDTGIEYTYVRVSDGNIPG